MILYIFLLSCAVWQAAAVWPCSQQITHDANGNEIWVCAEDDNTPAITYASTCLRVKSLRLDETH